MFDVAIYANQITFDGVGCSCFFSFLFSPSSASHSQRFDLVFKYVPVRFVRRRISCGYMCNFCCFGFFVDVLFIFIRFSMMCVFFMRVVVLFYCGFCFYFSRMSELAPCVCVWVRIRIAVIFFYSSICSHRFVFIQNCGCHASLVLRLVYFISVQFKMRTCDYTQRIFFVSLFSLSSSPVFITKAMNSFKCMKLTAFTHKC